MFETLGFLIGATMTTGAAGAGYVGTKRFVRERLRFVEEVQRPGAAWIAGGVATAVAIPVVALVPFIGGFTALLFGASVAVGTRAGARHLRRLGGGSDY